MLLRLRYWLRAVFRYGTAEREMHEEMQAHLDRRAEVLVASGLSPEAARLAARREFGNPAVHQDAGRDARRTRWVESIATDVRFAFRTFARRPLASATIVLVLAFGIGGHAFQVSALLAVTRRPPPGMPADVPLVRLRGKYRTREETRWHDRTLWSAELREAAALPNTFAAIAGWAQDQVERTEPGMPHGEMVVAQFVTDGYFRTIGVTVSGGPGLPPAADAGEPVGVITYGMWEDLFDRGEVTGRTVTLNGVPVRVVGVAPPAFTGALSVDNRHTMWLPLSARRVVLGLPPASPYANPESTYYEVVGRLAPGVTVERATAMARVVTARVAARMLPPPPPGQPPFYVEDSDIVPLRGMTSVHKEADLPVIATLWATLSMLILLVVCTNVGGLVISSAVGRQQEIAIRLSLGASRARVIRQLLTESMLLALAGAALGLVVLRAAVAAASRIPEAEHIRPDLATVVLTMIVAAGTGVLFGLAPAFHATRRGVGEVLKREGGTTRRSRLHQAFVVAQVVLTQPLLVLIATVVSFLTMENRALLPSGIPEHVLRLPVFVRSIPGSDSAQWAALDRLFHRIETTPGVVGVLRDPEPLRPATLAVRDEDRGPLARAKDPVPADMLIIDPGYFAFLGVPLLRGNDLPPADTGWTTIISSDLAHELWGSADPIGKRFTQISPTPKFKRDLVVTGVYDSRRLPSGTERARVFRSAVNWRTTNTRYLIRTSGPGIALADTIRRIAREELPSLYFDLPRTLAQLDAAAIGGVRAGRLAASACASLVLFLASIGLYGIVAISVGQRRREIGVRMALGARAAQVVGLFYRSGVTLGAVGLGIGLPLSLAAVRFMPALAQAGGLEGARPPSLILIGGGVAVIVLVVASIATLIPASRAATVDPVTALRTE